MKPDNDAKRKAEEEAKKIGSEYRRYRALVLSEVWCELRDAPSGPMMDAMKIVGRMMEEMERGERGDQGSGNG